MPRPDVMIFVVLINQAGSRLIAAQLLCMMVASRGREFVMRIADSLAGMAVAIAVGWMLPPPVYADPFTYRNAVLGDDPVGYWTFDETSGPTASDSGVNGLHGTYVNTPDLGVTGIFDDAGGAIGLNGLDEFVRVTDSGVSPLDVGAELTMEAWFRYSNTSGTMVFLNKENSYEAGVLSGRPAGAVQSDGGGAWFWFSDSEQATTNDWHHVVVTAQGTDFRLYVDGQLRTQVVDNGNGVITPSPADLLIGRRECCDGQYYQGDLDEVAIYDVALSAAQVEDHYDAAFAVPEPGALALLAVGVLGIGLLRRR